MPSDTFAIHRDTALYVPRLAAERAIALLRQKLFGSAGIVVLVGPPGIGKSVIAERAARGVERKATCVRLRLEGRSCEELSTAVIAELEASGAATSNEGDAADSPVSRMRSWVRGEAEAMRTGPERTLVDLSIRLRRQGRPLALFLDDADSIADRTVVRLYELATTSRSIAICLVLSEERSFEGLAKKLPVIHYDEPLSVPETSAYVNALLYKGDAPAELRQLLDEAMIRRIHAYTGGVPRRIHAEIALLQLDARARETARQDASTYPVVVPEPSVALVEVPSLELPRQTRARWITLGAAAGSALSALAALGILTFAPDLVLRVTARSAAEREIRSDVLAPTTPESQPSSASLVAAETAIQAERPAGDRADEGSSRLQAVAAGGPARAAEPPEQTAPAEPAPVQKAVAERIPEPVAARPLPEPVAARPLPEPVAARAPVRAAPRKPMGPEVAANTRPPAPALVKPTPARAKPAAAQPRAPAPTPAPAPEKAPAPAPAAPPAPLTSPAPVSAAPPTVAPALVPAPAPAPSATAAPATAPETPAPETQTALGEAAPLRSAKPQLFYADVNAVPKATITIDGVEIGQTPLGGLPLEEGIHQFRALMPDGRVLERAILISKDRQRILFE